MNPRNVTLGTFVATQKMRDFIEEILSTGRISYGPFSRSFERKFSAMHGCKYGILSNSGTSSLHVALQAMKELHGWRDGAEVIVPATTFVATANIVRHCRMTPVFCDVDFDTYNMSGATAVEAITENTVAAIPVHMFGQSADMELIKAGMDGIGAKVIEDSCETMFVTHEGKPVGSLGDIGCFSMYMAHLLVAGVGGISTTNNPDYAAKMRSLVNHGLSINQLNVDENFSPLPAVGRRFEFDTNGHSFRITEFEAAIALAQIDDWKDMLRKRRRNAQHLGNRLEDCYDITLPAIAQGNTHAWMMYPIVLNGQLHDKAAFMSYLNARGIQTRDMPTLLYQRAYPEINPDHFPISRMIANFGLYVGCHQDLEIEDMDYVADAILEYFHDSR